MLNLRQLAQPDSPSKLESKVDIFFRRAYGKPRNSEDSSSMMDTILGNIGEPLRVDDENGGGKVMAEKDNKVEEATNLEIIISNPPREQHHLDHADA